LPKGSQGYFRTSYEQASHLGQSDGSWRSIPQAVVSQIGMLKLWSSSCPLVFDSDQKAKVTCQASSLEWKCSWLDYELGHLGWSNYEQGKRSLLLHLCCLQIWLSSWRNWGKSLEEITCSNHR